MAETVLITTHDLELAGALRRGFVAGGYRVDLFTAREEPDQVEDPVLLALTGGAGTDAARRLARQASRLGLPVLAVSAAEDEAVPGATATFRRPVDPEEVVVVGRRAIERRRLREATGIVGETDAMMEVLERILQIAPVDVTVLIGGESGTGKELVARGIHSLSRRRHRVFIPVNVAALSETLLESELFGHEKGAFTGAYDSRKGLFELAQGGTIFLDEIGDMPVRTQTKLLRVIEQREFHRVGGEELVRVDVRILAATNQNLPRLVVSERFRRDLYYRLNVLNIALPPLRRRRADIPLLVDAFVREAKRRHDRTRFRGISAEAMDVLLRHRWPGNVRELRNLVESMVVLAPGREIRPEDIPDDVRFGRDPVGLVRLESSLPPSESELAPSLGRQMEFFFRSLMEMKVDVEELKRAFEAFRASEEASPLLIGPAPASVAEGAPRPVDADVRATAGEEGGEAEAPVDEAARPAAESDVPAAAADEDEEAGGAAPAIGYVKGMTLEDVERQVIQAALDSVRWNRRRASRMLGIGERTLYRKVKKYGLAKKGKRADGG